MNWWVYHGAFHKPLPPERYKRSWWGETPSATLTEDESRVRRVADHQFMDAVRAAAEFQMSERPTFENF